MNISAAAGLEEGGRCGRRLREGEGAAGQGQPGGGKADIRGG